MRNPQPKEREWYIYYRDCGGCFQPALIPTRSKGHQRQRHIRRRKLKWHRWVCQHVIEVNQYLKRKPKVSNPETRSDVKLTPDAPAPRWWKCPQCSYIYRTVHPHCLTCGVIGEPSSNPLPITALDADRTDTATHELYPNEA